MIITSFFIMFLTSFLIITDQHFTFKNKFQERNITSLCILKEEDIFNCCVSNRVLFCVCLSVCNNELKLMKGMRGISM